MSFVDLKNKDVSKNVEIVNKFKYLSWTHAWAEIKTIDENANYELISNPFNGLPYFGDDMVGYFVRTKVTFQNITHEMILPVLNGANKSMKKDSYTYTVFDKYTKKNIDKTVEAIDSFAINKAIMRCFVKCIAMHGLGLNLYTGEDFPVNQDESIKEIKPTYQNIETKNKNKFNYNVTCKTEFKETFLKYKEMLEACSSADQVNKAYENMRNELLSKGYSQDKEAIENSKAFVKKISEQIEYFQKLDKVA